MFYCTFEEIRRARQRKATISIIKPAGTGHYGSDGKLRDFGLVYFLNANGNLGFLKGIAGVYKDQIDKIGNAVTRLWLWKQ